MKKLLGTLFGFLIYGAILATAQTTVVSGTVTDSDGIAWANGSWQVQFMPNPSNPNVSVYNINGTPLSASVLNQSGSLDGTGAFSFTIYQDAAITPVGAGWKITVCPNATAQCGVYLFNTGSNSTLNLSSALTTVIPPPRFYATSNTFGYSDGEATLQLHPGNMYWNVSLLAYRAWNGTSWITVGSGGGGGGTPNPPAYSVQAANSALNGFTSDSLITIDTTQHTLNVGGALPFNRFILTNLQAVSSTWTFDVTSPATALASLGLIPIGTIVGPNGNTQCLALNGASPSYITTVPCTLTAVTSVAATVPPQMTVSGSPITSTGTLAFGLNTTGSGTKVVTATAAGASTHCANWTSAGDIGDAGAACATVPTTTWSDQYFAVTGCNTPNSTDGVCSGSITIPTAEPDTSYQTFLTINSSAGAYLNANVYGTLTTTTIPYQITCTYNCSVSTGNTIYVHVHHN